MMDDDVFKAEYTRTDIPGVWKVVFHSGISIVYDHVGYIFSDEAGQFSLRIYSTKEEALASLIEYNDGLNAYDATGHEI